jgi:hypothetical protein
MLIDSTDVERNEVLLSMMEVDMRNII